MASVVRTSSTSYLYTSILLLSILKIQVMSKLQEIKSQTYFPLASSTAIGNPCHITFSASTGGTSNVEWPLSMSYVK